MSSYSVTRAIVDLILQAVVGLLVWRYYRRRTYDRRNKYSTFAPRFWTGTVDACVLWPIGFALSVVIAIKLPASLAIALLLIQNLAWLVYTVFMHAKFGQTYGKMVCKVRVVDFATEGAISVRQALLRDGIPLALSAVLVSYQVYEILSGDLSLEAATAGGLADQKAFWLLAILPLLWFVAEAITMLSNDKSRALHDFIAGTVVIRTNVEEIAAANLPAEAVRE